MEHGLTQTFDKNTSPDGTTRRERVDPTDDVLKTILIEFGLLTDEQHALLDLHPQRALGTEVSRPIDGVMIEFSLRDGEDAAAAFDDIKGWAIVNRLPIRRMLRD